METVAHAEQGRGTAWLLGSACALVLALVIGVAIGPAGPAWWRVPLELLDRLPLVAVDSGVNATDWSIIWNIRMPRVVLAALVGSTLSIAGASYQGVFRNPLVDPYLLGVAAGAGLGATVVFTVNRSGSLSWPVDPLPLISFVGGLTAVLVTYVVGSAFGSDRSSTTLVLAGVAVTSLATAIQTFLLQRNSDVVRQVYSWILGRLSTATWGDVRLVLPYVLVSTGALLMHRRLLDVLRVGDEEASALGADPLAQRTRCPQRNVAMATSPAIGEAGTRAARHLPARLGGAVFATRGALCTCVVDVPLAAHCSFDTSAEEVPKTRAHILSPAARASAATSSHSLTTVSPDTPLARSLSHSACIAFWAASTLAISA